MFASLEKSSQRHRSGISFSSTIETFLDPAVAVATLFLVALAYGERPDAPYVIVALIVFSLTFPGALFLHERFRRMLRKTVINWLIVAAILVVFGRASGYISVFPEEVIQAWLLATPIALIGMHSLARWVVPNILAMEGYTRTAIIAGCNETGLRLAQNFAENRYIGVRFMGYFDDRARDRLEGIGDAPLLGGLEQLADFVKHHHVDHIYLALPMASQPRILKVLDNIKDTTASVFFVPDIFVTDLIQGQVDHVGGMPVVAVCETPFIGISGMIKRMSDVILATLILILISPVMLFVAIGVKRSSPGPVIFKQRRYGLDGKEIVVYKFRSMSSCDDGAVVKQASKNDQRITPFGAFIRRTSLDELPQFINVLQGRMSIVGPRPHAVAHNETYRKLIKGYMVRHKVKPGITGWAQVSGYRGETETVEKMEKRIEYDLEYLRNWSLSMDLWIIVKTVVLVFRDRHAY
ncbi:undecaprenyl-phosphate glucose phosphotransferase [Denitromonas ohlonensis]|uniref:Undecaprenyl-phosphate glucose phosphotransferase n=2 Tax=Denitromonas TaxID=139331 RepID=A0A557SKX8_9RHOO|nr:undecaprenyl-phosphate glucose phosphotransferase [Denitromonas ohlonensis]TVT47866.1 MAG: undecaprenyl-phosphate glucose phosphotransferase [Denitromonas halophila]TVO68095.1 undecaprenyl-phosphate glucose phosphotransferase [Denitromonas ohlonensis]TVO78000.1 undecaprenyl-phosphate glucose phosphotransferase [Denitromonas ohlonensis]TVT66551.1 MAG: undecaprenyl-phosphate glucose phosphotransferase [Denitromonas halophila]TVT78549.1 MAG: undecaprenyl-phosphate glucose phosphotransferase [D